MRSIVLWLAILVFIQVPEYAARNIDTHDNSSTMPKDGRRMQVDPDFALVIEYGRNGTTAHIYTYSWQSGQAFPHVNLPHDMLHIEMKEARSTSSTSSGNELEQEGAGAAQLDPLLKFIADTIPDSKRAATTFSFHVTTEGMKSQHNHTASLQLAQRLAQQGFALRHELPVHMSGRIQGALRWLALNYHLKRLHGMSSFSKGSVASLFLGRRTAQVATSLSPEEAAEDDAFQLAVNPPIALYSHSYMSYGLLTLMERYVHPNRGKRDPCLLSGVPNPGGGKGVGNFAWCQKKLVSLFDTTSPCELPPCSLGGVHQPAFLLSAAAAGANLPSEAVFVQGQLQLTLEALGLTAGVTVEEVERAGAHACSLGDRRGSSNMTQQQPVPGAEGRGHAGGEGMYGDTLCFRAVFASVFLSSGVLLPSSTVVQMLPRDVRESVDWPLGSMLQEVMARHKPPHPLHEGHLQEGHLAGPGQRGNGKRKSRIQQHDSDVRAMVMALVCGVLFIATLSMQQPYLPAGQDGTVEQGALGPAGGLGGEHAAGTAGGCDTFKEQ